MTENKTDLYIPEEVSDDVLMIPFNSASISWDMAALNPEFLGNVHIDVEEMFHEINDACNNFEDLKSARQISNLSVIVVILGCFVGVAMIAIGGATKNYLVFGLGLFSILCGIFSFFFIKWLGRRKIRRALIQTKEIINEVLDKYNSNKLNVKDYEVYLRESNEQFFIANEMDGNTKKVFQEDFNIWIEIVRGSQALPENRSLNQYEKEE